MQRLVNVMVGGLLPLCWGCVVAATSDPLDSSVPSSGSGGTSVGTGGTTGDDAAGGHFDGGLDAAEDANGADAGSFADADASDTGIACLPSRGSPCHCDDAGSGTRTCNDAGTGFGTCDCRSPAGDGGLGTTTTLYIHGRTGDYPDGGPPDWAYWRNVERPGVNPKPVNWDGAERIGVTNPTIRQALDTYCTGDNWCYVACHSAGCAQIGYALGLYGTTGGVERWNIYWVAAAGSAAGGSELADLKLFNVKVVLDDDLQTQVMRHLYNHDNTAGVSHWMFAGAGYADLGNWYYNGSGPVLPGDDDCAVAYHSSCGVNNTAYSQTQAWCNAGDLICPGSTIESAAQSDFWALHSIQYLDSNADYSHFLTDANEGICSRMFLYMAQYAQ